MKSHRRINFNALILSAVITVTLIFSVLVIFLIASTSSEGYNQYSVSADDHIGKFQSLYELNNVIVQKYSEHCENKTLYEIQCKFTGYEQIMALEGVVRLGYEEYIDNSNEGGNVSNVFVNYNFANEKVYKFDFSNGSAKAISIAKAEALNPEKWQIDIGEIVNRFVSEYGSQNLSNLEKPILSIRISNNKASVTLFAESVSGLIHSSSYDMNDDSSMNYQKYFSHVG